MSSTTADTNIPQASHQWRAAERRPVRRSLARRLLRKPSAFAAVVILAVVIVCAVLAPWIAPHDPDTQALDARFLWFSREHWVGTDSFGRDVASRLIWGARAAVEAPVIALLVACVLGMPTGLLSGFVKGKTDWIFGRIADALLSVPSIVLAIAFVAALGPSLVHAMVAVGVIYAPRLYRVTRAATLEVREEMYIEAARSVGCSMPRIIIVNVLPNIARPLLVQLSLFAGFAVLAEASLSFLGLGTRPPTASWGVMLREAFENNYMGPYHVIPPGVAIALLVLSFNLLGDALADCLGVERTRPR